MADRDQAWEVLLAKLFADADFRARFKQDRVKAAKEIGLDETALSSFDDADWVGLDLAARSYARKRGLPGKNVTSVPR